MNRSSLGFINDFRGKRVDGLFGGHGQIGILLLRLQYANLPKIVNKYAGQSQLLAFWYSSSVRQRGFGERGLFQENYSCR